MSGGSAATGRPGKPGPSPQQKTRERIIEAALRLFADRGFSETSLRMITSEAGVNLAAVNYHFGSKEELIAEVFGRLVGPINRERLERLDRIERGAGAGPPALEEVVEAFLAPALGALKRIGPIAIRLMGRAYAEPGDRLLILFREQFGEVAGRFAAALNRALPGLDRREVLWRLQFAVGSMLHTMAAYDRLETIFAGLERPTSADDLRRRLHAFICAGMRAGLPPGDGGAPA